RLGRERHESGRVQPVQPGRTCAEASDSLTYLGNTAPAVIMVAQDEVDGQAQLPIEKLQVRADIDSLAAVPGDQKRLGPFLKDPATQTVGTQQANEVEVKIGQPSKPHHGWRPSTGGQKRWIFRSPPE